MNWVKKIFGSPQKGLLEQAADIADRFIETPTEKKEFIERAFDREVKDRSEARILGRNKSAPTVLSYFTIVFTLLLGIAIFSDIITWETLTDVQKGLIQTFLGVFLAKLNDVYGYWFGSSMGSEEKTKQITKIMRNE
jgi:hypothetical protein